MSIIAYKIKLKKLFIFNIKILKSFYWVRLNILLMLSKPGSKIDITFLFL